MVTKSQSISITGRKFLDNDEEDTNENVQGEPAKKSKKPMKAQIFASDSDIESDEENNLILHLDETSHVLL